MLFNVGPDARGEIPAACVKILNEVGEWMRKNDCSLRACGQVEFPKPDWGRYTQRGKNRYAHIYERGILHSGSLIFLKLRLSPRRPFCHKLVYLAPWRCALSELLSEFQGVTLDKK